MLDVGCHASATHLPRISPLRFSLQENLPPYARVKSRRLEASARAQRDSTLR